MKLKWDISGKGEEPWGEGFTQYSGPVPPKGSYVAKIKRMVVGTINKQGDNHGKPRIAILLEIVGGSGSNGLNDEEYTYLHAPIWDGLNIIKHGTSLGKVNGFLHALTDGSKSAKQAVEDAFWPPNGPNAEKEKNRNGVEEVHIKKIGQYVIASPAGEHLVRIITKMGSTLATPERAAQPRAEINAYLPYVGPKPEPASQNGQVDDSGMEILEDD